MLSPTICDDHETLSQTAANWLAEQLRQKPKSLICLATGQSPSRTYTLLAHLAALEPSLLSQVQILKLDEWGGLPMNNPATCESFLQSRLIQPLNLGGRYIGFESNPEDPAAECARIEEWLSNHGPIDICVLGLGLNGHLGFNEPAATLQSSAHVAALSPESLRHPMIAAESTKPTYGLTLGMANIFQSRQILLLVSGPSKARAMNRLMSGPISTQFPASLLALHQNVKLLLDWEAASNLAVQL